MSSTCIWTDGAMFTETPNTEAIWTDGCFYGPLDPDVELRVPQRMTIQEIQQAFLRVQQALRVAENERTTYLRELTDVMSEEYGL